jgi:hypothetical protein
MKAHMQSIKVSHQRVDPIIKYIVVPNMGWYGDKVKAEVALCKLHKINMSLPAEEVDELLRRIK